METFTAKEPHDIRAVPGLFSNPVFTTTRVGDLIRYEPGSNLDRLVDGFDWIYIERGTTTGWTEYKGKDFGSSVSPVPTPQPVPIPTPVPTPAPTNGVASLWLTLDEVRQFNADIHLIESQLTAGAAAAKAIGAMLDKVIDRALEGEADTTRQTT